MTQVTEGRRLKEPKKGGNQLHGCIALPSFMHIVNFLRLTFKKKQQIFLFQLTNWTIL